MLITIDALLSPDEAAHALELLARAPWVDGARTAGGVARAATQWAAGCFHNPCCENRRRTGPPRARRQSSRLKSRLSASSRPCGGPAWLSLRNDTSGGWSIFAA